MGFQAWAASTLSIYPSPRGHKTMFGTLPLQNFFQYLVISLRGAPTLPKNTLYFTGLLVFLFLWIVVCDKNTYGGDLKKGGFVLTHSLTTQLIMAKKVLGSCEVTFCLQLGGRGRGMPALILILSSLPSLGTNPEDRTTQSGWVFPRQLNRSRTILIDKASSLSPK